MTAVFDSSALLAHFLGEAGGVTVREMLAAAKRQQVRIQMSPINLAEVTNIVLRRRGGTALREFLGWLDQLPITIVPADRDLAVAAGTLKYRLGIPYGDCFAAALAHRLSAEVVTRDPDFEKVQSLVKVVWIGTPRSETER